MQQNGEDDEKVLIYLISNVHGKNARRTVRKHTNWNKIKLSWVE